MRGESAHGYNPEDAENEERDAEFGKAVEGDQEKLLTAKVLRDVGKRHHETPEEKLDRKRGEFLGQSPDIESAQDVLQQAIDADLKMSPEEQRAEIKKREAEKAASGKAAKLENMSEADRALSEITETHEGTVEDFKSASAKEKADKERRSAAQKEDEDAAIRSAKAEMAKGHAVRKRKQLENDQASIDSARAELKTTEQAMASARKEMAEGRGKRDRARLEREQAAIDSARAELKTSQEAIDSARGALKESDFKRREKEAAGLPGSEGTERIQREIEEDEMPQVEKDFFRHATEQSKEAERKISKLAAGELSEDDLPTADQADVSTEREAAVDKRLVPSAEEMGALKQELAGKRGEAARLEQECKTIYDRMPAKTKAIVDRPGSALGNIITGMRGLFNRDLREYNKAWNALGAISERIQELEAATEPPKKLSAAESEMAEADRTARRTAKRAGGTQRLR